MLHPCLSQGAVPSPVTPKSWQGTRDTSHCQWEGWWCCNKAHQCPLNGLLLLGQPLQLRLFGAFGDAQAFNFIDFLPQWCCCCHPSSRKPIPAEVHPACSTQTVPGVGLLHADAWRAHISFKKSQTTNQQLLLPFSFEKGDDTKIIIWHEWQWLKEHHLLWPHIPRLLWLLCGGLCLHDSKVFAASSSPGWLSPVSSNSTMF